MKVAATAAHTAERPVALARFSYRYGSGVSGALDNITLDIDAGLTALAGPSGSGKSSLLRVFNGLVPHFHGGTVRGQAHIFGHDVVRTPTRLLSELVGFVFQDPELQAVYGTVERDIAFGLENANVPRAEMHARVDEALARAGIVHLRRRDIRTLSGGERQRAALASVLAMRPSLLALDEPLAQLDDASASALLTTLDELAGDGVTVVVAEHRLAELTPRAGRLIRLEDGRVRDGVVAGPSRLGEGLAQPAPPSYPQPRALARAAMPSTSSAPAWSLSNVAAGPAREAVVSQVELAGNPGEVTVLVGPNGGGKTTLLRTIAGLIAPLSGTVERAPGRVAYLPQNPTALLHRPTVRAEVELTLRGAGTARDVDAILDTLSLTHVAARYPRDLSTGERQRAALAAVLVGAPRIALLDEPTRGMDATARDALIQLIRRLVDGGAAVVMATHDRDLAASVAHRVVAVGDRSAREVTPPAVPA